MALQKIQGFSLRIRLLILGAVSFIIIIFDQVTKYFVHTKMFWGQSIAILPPIFSFTYVRNKGAAFGLFQKSPAYFREPFLLIVPIIAFIILLIIIVRSKPYEKIETICFSLISGGALSNLLDRALRGFVVDFIDIHWKEVYHWPPFNIADSSIVIGVSILFILSFTSSKKMS